MTVEYAWTRNEWNEWNGGKHFRVERETSTSSEKGIHGGGYRESMEGNLTVVWSKAARLGHRGKERRLMMGSMTVTVPLWKSAFCLTLSVRWHLDFGNV